jgi:hypothetical protein
MVGYVTKNRHDVGKRRLRNPKEPRVSAIVAIRKQRVTYSRFVLARLEWIGGAEAAKGSASDYRRHFEGGFRLSPTFVALFASTPVWDPRTERKSATTRSFFAPVGLNLGDTNPRNDRTQTHL